MHRPLLEAGENLARSCLSPEGSEDSPCQSHQLVSRNLEAKLRSGTTPVRNPEDQVFLRCYGRFGV